MRLYELTVIFDSSLDETSLQSEIDKIENRITGSGGRINRLDRWGNKRLAYEIAGHTQGYYVFFLFEGRPGLIMELERNMRINDKIIRFLAILSQSEAAAPAEKKRADESVTADESESTRD